jgi:hypothetical protein
MLASPPFPDVVIEMKTVVGFIPEVTSVKFANILTVSPALKYVADRLYAMAHVGGVLSIFFDEFVVGYGLK